jgi:hypothetical protein
MALAFRSIDIRASDGIFICFVARQTKIIDYAVFDVGAIAISDDMRVLGLPDRPRLHLRHPIDPESVSYHRRHFGLGIETSKSRF